MNLNSSPSKRHLLFADIGLFYAAAVWGSTFIIVKAALEHIDPITMVAYRFLIAGSVLLVFLIVTGRPVFEGWKRAALLAGIIWTLYVPQTIGLKYTTASNSGFITGLFVIFVPIFLRTLFKTKPNRMEVLASVVALIGLWILTGGMTRVNIGDLLSLAAAMSYALHLLYSDKFMKMKIDPYVISCQQFLFVGIYSLITVLLFDLPLSVGNVETFGVVLFLALFPTLSAFLIQMLAQQIVSPLKVSLIFALEPVFAGIFAWTVGGEELLLSGAIGGSLIFAALIISGLPAKKTVPAKS
ncbi:MAG: DMT family transporter [bacterium]|nr:DMT family transporter [bacterium]